VAWDWFVTIVPKDFSFAQAVSAQLFLRKSSETQDQLPPPRTLQPRNVDFWLKTAFPRMAAISSAAAPLTIKSRSLV
jgi:hypothetical protein